MKISIVGKIFDNLDFILNLPKSRFYSKFSKILNFCQNFRKILALVKFSKILIFVKIVDFVND